jgi:hypothetical protein
LISPVEISIPSLTSRLMRYSFTPTVGYMKCLPCTFALHCSLFSPPESLTYYYVVPFHYSLALITSLPRATNASSSSAPTPRRHHPTVPRILAHALRSPRLPCMRQPASPTRSLSSKFRSPTPDGRPSLGFGAASASAVNDSAEAGPAKPLAP